MKAWRERMGTVEAQTIYKDRAATAECVNALARQRGLQQFLVRGLHEGESRVALVCPGAQPDAERGLAGGGGRGLMCRR